LECIILAGGLGTRLQGVIGAMPKCMAVVAKQPFLFHVFQYLSTQKCTRVVLSLGYKHEFVLDWLHQNDWSFEIDYVIEDEPLGTGGGINLALTKCKEENVFVLNGDTMFRVDLEAMLDFHLQKKSTTTLALKSLSNFERYGVVITDKHQLIVSFEEKKFYSTGIINGGVYIINRALFSEKKLPNQYSFEKDYLEKHISSKQFYGFMSKSYFIDIGIPLDYEQAQIDFE
jgi:D-glycero-alpha-D-manno-heptose 1-phosphate guanylyltransferase